MTRAEMIAVLEGIARDGSPGLQIQAIRVLLTLQDGGDPEAHVLERLLQTK